MISIKKRHQGITLFEVLLVLAVGVSLLILSLRQFQSYQRDASVEQLRTNVNTLFYAMAGYHQANCYGVLDPNNSDIPPGQILPGQLNPSNPNVKEVMPINIADDLVTAGYLQTKLPSILPLNPIVNNNDGAVAGYLTQFNQQTSDRLICTETTGGAVSGFNDPNCTSTKKMATIITWKAQVSVLLADPTLSDQYLRLTGADCLSQLNDAGDSVRPCSENMPGDFLVWERLPSFASPELSTDYWLLNPTVQQFNQMYSTYPILHLISSPNEGNSGSGSQYILCSS